MQSRDVLAGRARYVSFVVASLSVLQLLAILSFGLMWLTTDWRVLALRVRRVTHVVPVLLLCATGVVIAQALWWRL